MIFYQYSVVEPCGQLCVGCVHNAWLEEDRSKEYFLYFFVVATFVLYLEEKYILASFIQLRGQQFCVKRSLFIPSIYN